MDLESTSYTVSENNDVVEVCAVLYTPDISCPIKFAFDIRVSTSVDSSSGAGSGGSGGISDDIAGEDNTGEGSTGGGSTGEGSTDEGSTGEGSTVCRHYTTCRILYYTDCVCSLHSQAVHLF